MLLCGYRFVFVCLCLLGARLAKSSRLQPPPEIWVAGLFPSYRGSGESISVDRSGIQRTGAFLVALNEINSAREILPNTTLKFGLGNSRRDSNHVVEETVQLVEAIRKNASALPVAIVGPASSGPSQMVQRVCNGLHLPQIGYSATSPSLSDVTTYKYFARLPPSDGYQVTVMVNLIQSIVGIDAFATIAGPDLYSTSGIDALAHVATSAPYNMNILKEYNVIRDSRREIDLEKLSMILNELKDGQCNVVAVFAQAGDYKSLFETAASIGLNNMVWVVSETFKSFYTQYRSTLSMAVLNVMQRVIFADVESGKNLNANISKFSEFKRLWSLQGNNGEINADDLTACSDAQDNLGRHIWRIDHDNDLVTSPRCTGFDFARHGPTMYGSYTPFVYDAVWALGRALHEMIYVRQRFSSIADFPSTQDRIELFDILKNDTFQGASGIVQFFPSGDRDTGTVTYTVHRVNMGLQGPSLVGIGEFRGRTFLPNEDGQVFSSSEDLTQCACIDCPSVATVRHTVVKDLPAWAIALIVVLPILFVVILFYIYNSLKIAINAKSDAWKIDPEEVTIKKTLGAGQYGTVFLGLYGSTRVAVKQFDEKKAKNTDEFVSELVTLVDLRHAHLVQFIGAILETKSLVSDYMDMGDLKTILHDENVQLSGEKMYNIAYQIGLGLEYLHSKGIAHCDMKSENVLVDKHWVVKIADFGLSGFVNSARKRRHSRHRTGSFSSRSFGRKSSKKMEKDILKAAEAINSASDTSGSKGSLLYLPPEVIEGGEYTCEGDIYAYGFIIFEIITRRIPFQDLSLNVFKLQLEIANNDLRPSWPKIVDKDEAEAMKDLRDIAEKCWVKDVSSRVAATKACKSISRGMNQRRQSLSQISIDKTLEVEGEQSIGTGLDKTPSESDFTVENEEWYISQEHFANADKCMPNGYGRGTVMNVGEVFTFSLSFRRAKTLAKRERSAKAICSEISLLSSLQHDNIFSFVGSTWNPLHNGKSYIFYKVRETEKSLLDLEQLLEVNRDLEPYILLSIPVQVCCALKYLHEEHSIIHGFLNHKSIFVTPAPEMKVKLSRIEGNVLRSNKESIDIDDQINMGWASPEVLILSHFSEASDVFSLGVLLWYILTQRVPFEGEKPVDVHRKILNDGHRPTITMKDVEKFKFQTHDPFMSYIDIIQRAWEQKLEDRLPLNTIYDILKSWSEEGILPSDVSTCTQLHEVSAVMV